MRITGGSLKGRKLVSWKGGPDLRPMTAQTREALFNALRPRFFKGCAFLDLFSGTGCLALEALSRGAGLAHAVESHPRHFELIKKNRKLLPVPQKLVLHKKNVFSFLSKNAGKAEASPTTAQPTTAPPTTAQPGRLSKRGKAAQRNLPEKFDIITADPPFALNAGMKVLESLQESSFVGPGTVLVVETGQHELLKEHWPLCHLFKKKRFNDKKIHFYEFE